MSSTMCLGTPLPAIHFIFSSGAFFCFIYPIFDKSLCGALRIDPIEEVLVDIPTTLVYSTLMASL